VHPDHLETAKAALKNTVEAVLKPDFEVENPVTRTRALDELRRHATPETRLFLEAIEDLRLRMSSVEMRTGSDQIGPASTHISMPKVVIFDVHVDFEIEVEDGMSRAQPILDLIRARLPNYAGSSVSPHLLSTTLYVTDVDEQLFNRLSLEVRTIPGVKTVDWRVIQS
jgi:hypothetical protein